MAPGLGAQAASRPIAETFALEQGWQFSRQKLKTIVKLKVLVVQSCPTLAGRLCPWDSAVKNTGVGNHFLLWRISLTQGLNPGLPLSGRFFAV